MEGEGREKDIVRGRWGWNEQRMNANDYIGKN